MEGTQKAFNIMKKVLILNKALKLMTKALLIYRVEIIFLYLYKFQDKFNILLNKTLFLNYLGEVNH